jgi:hypothetical protein
MEYVMRNLIKAILPVLDYLLFPFVYPAAYLLKFVRRAGVHNLPLCKQVLMRVGVFPIRSHYYEPLFDGSILRRPLSQERLLPGISWNVDEQLQILERLSSYKEELQGIPNSRVDDLTFYLNNGSFEGGDANYWYNFIRLKKPARIIEIGSGNSTLLTIKAIRRIQEETPGYKCMHICIEPYEMPWLEASGVNVLRQRVEEVDKSLFSDLTSGDILFIDSSHIIRPQGDVLFEYLELIPSLKKGVIVHIHDIFSPRDYSAKWVIDEVKLWNEQYLLEAFLTCNNDWKIIGALNFLHHNFHNTLKASCPLLESEREPGSFYIEKIA